LQGKKRKAADGYAGEGRAEQLAELLLHLQGVPHHHSIMSSKLAPYAHKDESPTLIALQFTDQPVMVCQLCTTVGIEDTRHMTKGMAQILMAGYWVHPKGRR